MKRAEYSHHQERGGENRAAKADSVILSIPSRPVTACRANAMVRSAEAADAAESEEVLLGVWRKAELLAPSCAAIFTNALTSRSATSSCSSVCKSGPPPHGDSISVWSSGHKRRIPPLRGAELLHQLQQPLGFR